LSKIQTEEEPFGINDVFLGVHLFRTKSILEELAKILQLLQEGQSREELTEKKKKILTIKVAQFTLINGSL
jgi:hypothetical protein